MIDWFAIIVFGVLTLATTKRAGDNLLVCIVTYEREPWSTDAIYYAFIRMVGWQALTLILAGVVGWLVRGAH